MATNITGGSSIGGHIGGSPTYVVCFSLSLRRKEKENYHLNGWTPPINATPVATPISEKNVVLSNSLLNVGSMIQHLQRLLVRSFNRTTGR